MPNDNIDKYIRKASLKRRSKGSNKKGSWAGNALKSMGYIGADVFSELVPSTIDTVKMTAETGKDVFEKLKDLRTSDKTIKNAIQQNYYKGLAKDVWKNSLEDLKSGKIYNKERVDAGRESDSNDLGDFDFDFGGDEDFEDFDGSVSSDDGSAEASVAYRKGKHVDVTNVSVSTDMGPDSAIVQSTDYQTKVNLEVGKTLRDEGRVNARMNLTAINTFRNETNASLSSINDNLTKISSVVNETLSKHSSLAAKYYEDSIKVQTSILEAVQKMSSGTIGDANTLSTNRKEYKDVLDIFGSGGAIDFSSYKDIIKQNASNMSSSNSIISQLKFMNENKEVMTDIARNPLGELFTTVTKSLIPGIIKGSLKNFDNTLRESFTSALTQISGMQRSDNFFANTIGALFGVQNKMQRSVDKSSYNKGAVAWSGTDHQALTNVIPTLLRKMYAYMSGTPELGFDYDQGKFRTVKSIEREQQDADRSRMISSFSGYRSDFTRYIDKAIGADKNTKVEKSEIFDKFIENLVRDEYGGRTFRKGGRNGKGGDDIADLLSGIGSDEDVKLIRSYFKGLESTGQYDKIMEFFGTAPLEARANYTKHMRDQENDPVRYNTIYRQSGLSGSDIGTDAHLKYDKSGTKYIGKSGGIGGGRKDKFGKDQLWYLRNILQTLNTGIYVVPTTSQIPTPTDGKFIIVNGKKQMIGGGENKSPLSGVSDAIGNRRQTLISEFRSQTKDKQKKEDEIAGRTSSSKAYDPEKDKSKGKVLLNTDDLSQEQLDAAATSYLQESLSEENGETKPNFLQKLLGFIPPESAVGKLIGKIGLSIRNGNNVVSSTINKASKAVFELIFGKDGEQGGLKQKLVAWLDSTKLFFKEKIFDPLHDRLFGDEGIFTRLSQSEFFKDLKEKFSTVIFGDKDANGNRSNGIFSSIFNQFKDMGANVKVAIFGEKTADGKRVPLEEDNSVFGNIKKIFNNVKDSVSSELGVSKKDKPKTSITQTISDTAKYAANRIKGRVDEWGSQIFGKGDKSDGDNFLNEFKEDMKGQKGFIGASAILGGVGSMVLSKSFGVLGSFFLPGGPIGGALLGAGIGMLSRSNRFKNFLFGEKDEDGKRTGGLITKEFQDFFKDNKLGIGIGGIGGLILGHGLLPALFTPLGPIGGALAGAGISIAAKSGAFNELLYGPGGTKEKPLGGLLGKLKSIFGKDKKFKDLAIDAGVGAGVGLLGSFFLPGGPILGAMLGSAVSVVTGTEKFKEWFFGKDDGKGNRTGGIFNRFTGYMKDKVFNPLATAVKATQIKIVAFVKENMALPFKYALKPLVEEAKFIKNKIGDSVKSAIESIKDKFHKRVTKPIGETVDKYIINPLKGLMKKFFGGMGKLVGGIISAPFKALNLFGRGAYENQKKRGVKDFKDRAFENSAFSKSSRERRKQEGVSFGPFGSFRTDENGKRVKVGKGWFGSLRDYLGETTDSSKIDDAKYSDRGAWYDRKYKVKHFDRMKNEQRKIREERDRKLSKLYGKNPPKSSKDDTTKEKKRRFTRDKKVKSSTTRKKNVEVKTPNVIHMGGPVEEPTSKVSSGSSKGPKIKTKGGDGSKGSFKSKVKSSRGKVGSKIASSSKPNKHRITRRKKDTNDYLSDILRRVKSIDRSTKNQLNGVGKNVNKLYRLLLKLNKMNDDDITGDDNKEYMGPIRRFFNRISEGFKDFRDRIKGIITNPFKNVAKFFKGVKDNFVKFIIKPIKVVGKAFNLLTKGIGKALKFTWGFAKTLVKSTVKLGKDLFGIGKDIFKAGLKLVKNFGKTAAKALNVAFSVVGAVVKTTGKALLSSAKVIGSALAKGAKALGNTLLSATSKLGKFAGKAMDKAWDTLKKAGSVIGKGAKALGKGILTVGKFIGSGIKKGLGFLGSIPGRIRAKRAAKKGLGSILNPMHVIIAGGKIDEVDKVRVVYKVGVLYKLLNKLFTPKDEPGYYVVDPDIVKKGLRGLFGGDDEDDGNRPGPFNPFGGPDPEDPTNGPRGPYPTVPRGPLELPGPTSFPTPPNGSKVGSGPIIDVEPDELRPVDSVVTTDEPKASGKTSKSGKSARERLKEIFKQYKSDLNKNVKDAVTKSTTSSSTELAVIGDGEQDGSTVDEGEKSPSIGSRLKSAFGEFGGSIRDYVKSSRKGSREEVIEKLKEADEKKKQSTMLSTLVQSTVNSGNESKKHFSIWRSIFSKKGLITGGLILAAPLIFRAVRGIISFFKNTNFGETIKNLLGMFATGFSEVGGIKGMIQNIAELVADYSSAVTGKDTQYKVDENGELIYDENGQLETETKSVSFAEGFGTPSRTRIDVETGDWSTENRYTSTSGAKLKATTIAPRKFIRGVGKLRKTLHGKKYTNSLYKYGTKATNFAKKTGLSKAASSVKNAVKSSVKSAVKETTTSSKFIGTFIKNATEILTKLATKLAALGKKFGVDLVANKITKVIEPITKKVLNSKTLSKFATRIKNFFVKFTGKAAASTSTAGLLEIGFAVAGLVSGAANASNLFEVDSDAVDLKMRAISSVFQALLNTTPGSIIDVIASIVYEVTGTNILKVLATFVYGLLSDEQDREALNNAQDAFTEDYEEYQKKEYEAYVKDCEENGQTAMSEEEFKQSDLSTTRSEYNAERNKTLGKRIVDGVKNIKKIGSKIKSFGSKVKDKLSGTKVTTDYTNTKIRLTDKDGNYYVYNKGTYDYYASNGTKISDGHTDTDIETMLKKGKLVASVNGASITQGKVNTLTKAINKSTKSLWEASLKNKATLVTTTAAVAAGTFKELRDNIKEKGFIGGIKEFFSKTTKKAYFDFNGGYYTKESNGTYSYYNANGDKVSSNIDESIVLDKLTSGLLTEGEVQKDSAAKTAVNKIASAVKSAWETAKNTVSNAWNKFKDFIGLGGYDDEETTVTDAGAGGKGGKRSNVYGGYGSGETVNGTPYYSQNDPRYKNQAYNESTGKPDTIGNRGCGPTAMAMVASKLTGEEVDPVLMSKLAESGGYSTEVGTTPGYFRAAASALGINSSEALPTKDSIAKALLSGQPIILQGKGDSNSSPFTEEGHYVTVTGIKGNNLIINDPRGKDKSGRYNLDEVLNNSTGMWSFGASDPGDTDGSTITTSGLGSENMTEAEQAVVGKMMSLENKLKYNRKLRDKIEDGYGDCSSTVRYVYNKTVGIDPGGYTGAQIVDSDGKDVDSGGTYPNENNLRPGDLVFYGNPSAGNAGVNHVEMYVGDGTLMGHGGGTDGSVPGPHKSSLQSRAGRYIKARRYLTDGTQVEDGSDSTIVGSSSSDSSSSSFSSITDLLSGFASAITNPILKELGLSVDDDSTSTDTDTSTSTATQLTGDDTVSKVWNFFTQSGYSKAATAGILGNMYQESGIDPTNIQDNGAGPAAGIVQWENYNTKSGRWKEMYEYAKSKGRDWTDLQSQLEYVDKELQNNMHRHYFDILGGTTYEDWKSSDDVKDATLTFEKVFERAGIPRMQNRYNAANKYYSLYANGTGGMGGGKGGSNRISSKPVRRKSIPINLGGFGEGDGDSANTVQPVASSMKNLTTSTNRRRITQSSLGGSDVLSQLLNMALDYLSTIADNTGTTNDELEALNSKDFSVNNTNVIDNSKKSYNTTKGDNTSQTTDSKQYSMAKRIAAGILS